MMRIVTILESNNMTIKEGDTKDIFKLGLSYADVTSDFKHIITVYPCLYRSNYLQLFD